MDEQTESIVIDGVIEDIIYQNSLNGYTVFGVRPFSDVPKITCVANLTTPANEGETVKMSGRYTLHPLYGRQFAAALCEKQLPTEADDILKYLSSGAIPGIREKTAAKIVKKFGADTTKIIEESPERLAEVPGITPQKARSIGQIFQEQAVQRKIMLFLQKYDISLVFAKKIYEKYKENTIAAISANPYILADDIAGIGFLTADKLAFKFGITVDSLFRVKAGIKYTLMDASGDGHCFLPIDELCEKSSQILNVPLELIQNGIAEMRLDRMIFVEDEAIFLSSNFYMESYVAKKLLKLSHEHRETTQKLKTLDGKIRAIEAEEDIYLAENQKLAVKDALTHGVLVITGGPGTGKTTTINAIIKIFQREKLEIKLAAPTGRAAKRMNEATGLEAETIHRLLGSNFGKGAAVSHTFEKNEESPIEADVLIIDESSMVDLNLMYHLLKAVADGTRLILVGDVDQLPSVGAGNVLKDIISSGAIPTVRLTEIFRQARESAIVTNAHLINSGQYPIINEQGKDFFIVRRKTLEECAIAVRDLFTRRLPSFTGCTPTEIQVLTPTRKGLLGVGELNTTLQAAVNPPRHDKAEKEGRFGAVVFREGDRVMQIKNNYNTPWTTFDFQGNQSLEGVGVFNGDEGIIAKIDAYSENIIVRFDDGKVVTYDYSRLEELELSYAVTIHKSQGSEYRVVIIPLFGGPPMLMTRNLLYTAVTRAKELVVIVGSVDTMFGMVNNAREVRRYTRLNQRIVKIQQTLEMLD